jgi:hypothetical protein
MDRDIGTKLLGRRRRVENQQRAIFPMALTKPYVAKRADDVSRTIVTADAPF